MRKSFVVIGTTLLTALVASATDWPKYEAFLGYNFVRFNPDSTFLPSFNANGGSGQFGYNFNRWLSGVVDIGAVNKGTLNGFSIDATVVDFVAGPRYTYRNHSRFQPYAQALFGGAYATASAPVTVLPNNGILVPPIVPIVPGLPISARLTASRTGFAMLVGGGLDVKVSKHIAVRPFEASYYLTRLPTILTGNTNNQNNFRYAAGVNFLFGAR